MRLQDKVAVITGGASGMGRATALRFLAEGASVVIADFNATTGEETLGLAAAAGHGERIRFIRTDVAREADIEAMIGHAVSSFGRLDILFNNAGVGGAIGPLTETTVEDWDYTFDVLAKGVFLGIKHAAPVMDGKDTKGGVIINVSSSLTLKPSPGNAAYSVSKSGINMLTKIAAIELAEKNIRVNTVFPGPTLTPIWDPLTNQMQMTHEAFEKAVGDKITLFGRMGRAIDIAHTILYLASDEASFMTGAELLVDGGEVLQRDQPIFDTVSDAADIVFK